MDGLQTSLQSALRLEPSRRERRFSDADRAAATRSPFMPVSSSTPGNWPSPLEATPSLQPQSPQLHQHQCVATQCAVQITFGMTELLELILGYLGNTDVLNLRRVCRKWTDVVRESPTLRLHLFVNPMWHRDPEQFELLDLKLPGLTIVKGAHVEMGRWIEVEMSRDVAHQISPDAVQRRPRARSIYEGLRGGLGPRHQGSIDRPVPGSSADQPPKHEDLMVMQPPVVGMQAFQVVYGTGSTSGSTKTSETLCAKLYCEAGIKLGFLADTAVCLMPNTSTTIVFKAIVSFSPPPKDQRKRRTDRNVTYIS